jgi:heptosyltransferase-2
MQRILLIQTAFIGDVILSLPVAQRLHASYPQAAIHLLVKQGHEGLVANHPAIARVWTWDKSRRRKYLRYFELVRSLRAERFDLVVNMQRFAATGLLTWLLRSRYKACFRSNPFSFACGHHPRHRIGPVGAADAPHEVDRNLSLIAPWADTHREAPRLYPSEADFERIRPYTRRGPYVVVAPATLWFTKQMPRAKWAELLRQLSAQYRVYLVGSAAEQELCQELAMLHIHGENLAGRLTLLQSAALMAGAAQVFCNDSAPMHLASAVGAPTTAIYCSTVPDFGFGPLSAGSRCVSTSEALDCRPCSIHGLAACPQKHFRCGHSLDVHEILGEFRK